MRPHAWNGSRCFSNADITKRLAKTSKASIPQIKQVRSTRQAQVPASPTNFRLRACSHSSRRAWILPQAAYAAPTILNKEHNARRRSYGRRHGSKIFRYASPSAPRRLIRSVTLPGEVESAPAHSSPLIRLWKQRGRANKICLKFEATHYYLKIMSKQDAITCA